MEISGINRLGDIGRIISAPELLPGRVQTKVPEQPQQTPVQQPAQMPDQAPKTPVVKQNFQSFSNLLLEIGVPNTKENNNLANVLANYGQPVNKQSMNQVSQALGPLMSKGVSQIEAGVVLLLNGAEINANSINAIKNLLNGGGLSQNLLSLNKDLQKLVDNFGNKDFKKEISEQINRNHNVIENPQNNTLNQQLTGMASLSKSNENIEKIKPNTTAIKMNEEKVEQLNQVQKNPYQEEFNEDEESGGKYLINNNSSKSLSVMPENKLPSISMENIEKIIESISNKANKINSNITNILTIDVLKNPAQFPVQISLLRKLFSDLEKDISEFKKVLKYIFNVPDELSEEEDIFTDLLRLVLGDDEPDQKVKAKIKQNVKFDLAFIKDLLRVAESLNSNLLAREILTKSVDCMCIPLMVPVNNKMFNVEVMVQRDDKSNKKVDLGHVPLKIQLSMETNNLGKLSVEIRNLKKDLQIFLSVENNEIKEKIQLVLFKLEEKIQKLPFELKALSCNVNPKPDQSPSILLPPKYKVFSMKRIEGVV